MSNKMALDALTEFDEALTTWANAYPESVFPSPDLAKAAKLLEAGGMTLDAISADAMRHIAKTMHADFADCRAAIAALQPEHERNAARLAFMQKQMLAADFDYDGECVLVFQWPRSAPVGADLIRNIDAALLATPPKD
jgi:hypothetical protein